MCSLSYYFLCVCQIIPGPSLLPLMLLLSLFNYQEYHRMTKKDGCHPDVWTNLACCYFFLGMYPDSDAACQKG